VGVESRAFLLGPLVAQRLETGFAEVHKGWHPDDLGEALLRRTTAPDYRNRGIVLAMRRHVIRPRDRVLLVDDWIETGPQAGGVRRIVADAEADWVGVAVIVDALTAGRRQNLNVKSLLRVR